MASGKDRGPRDLTIAEIENAKRAMDTADGPTRATSIEEDGIREQIASTERYLQELHKRLRLEMRITEIKMQADALRHTI